MTASLQIRLGGNITDTVTGMSLLCSIGKTRLERVIDLKSGRSGEAVAFTSMQNDF